MDDVLAGYSVSPETWFYLSLLLIVAVFFRFSRVWSLRNFDLLMLLTLSPGLLFVAIPDLPESSGYRWVGYCWLFVVTGVVLLRVVGDPLFKRRPRLDQNLNVAGLSFLCVAAFAFQVINVFTESPPASSVEAVRAADRLLNRQDSSANPTPVPPRPEEAETHPGPATKLLTTPVVPASKLVAGSNVAASLEPGRYELIAARLMAVLAHFAAALGLVMVGRKHLGDVQSGVAMATLYLLLPCTAYDVGKVNHVLPAALIVWAFVAHQRPMVAGSLMGLACGTVLFPVFLLPLWAVFYGRRAAVPFGLALGIVAALLLGSLALTSADSLSFTRQTLGSIEWSLLSFRGNSAIGFWHEENRAYRLPAIVAFFVLLTVLTAWPLKKNLEHLMSHSTAIVVATQFWYPQHGGAYVLWYLPLLLMVVFRPKLTNLGSADAAVARTDVAVERKTSALPLHGGAAISIAGNGRKLR